jgi:hypothetical protein
MRGKTMKAEELLKAIIKDLDEETAQNILVIKKNIKIIRSNTPSMFLKIESAQEIVECLLQIDYAEYIKSEYLNYKFDKPIK